MIDPTIMANEFNNDFETLAKQIKGKLIKPKLHFENYLSYPVEGTLTFRPTNEVEVTGLASIPNDFLELFKKWTEWKSKKVHC